VTGFLQQTLATANPESSKSPDYAVRAGRTNAGIMDTLAAAYAEAGQFTNTVQTEQEAISLLTTETR
jgi:hypothetical protein